VKIRDDILLTWLCAFRLNLNGATRYDDEEASGTFYIPTQIREELVERGWATILEKSSDGNGGVLHITEAGTLASDLFSPEAGVDPVPEDCEA